MSSSLKLLLVIALYAISTLPTRVQASSNTINTKQPLTIITSFSHQYTNEFRRHFVKKHPDIKIKFIKMKTGDAIKYFESTKGKNITDLFMASSPEVFEVMKKKGLFQSYNPNPSGIPDNVLAFPINENNNLYNGFALSGTGFMWNLRYLDAKSLPIPNTWNDLTKAEYHSHLVMSSPSRSSTTHTLVENILQSHGWYAGWSIIKKIGGNLKTVTNKSSDVPTGVIQGKYGIGLMIDYYALTAKAHQHPVNFSYSEKPYFLPASIGLIKNAPNKEKAMTFINFLLSEKGQTILLSRNIQRLPVLPSVYESAADSFPNPFSQQSNQSHQSNSGYDLELSKSRYHLVNSLFENMITFNLEALQQSIDSMNRLSLALKNSTHTKTVALIKARRLLKLAQRNFVLVPVPKRLSQDEEYLNVFTQKRKMENDPLNEEQKSIEMEWNIEIQEQYSQIQKLVEQGLELLEDSRVSVSDK